MQEKTLCHVKILIASPSDVAEERDMAVEVINEWNIRNKDVHKLEIEGVLWESHSAPESGDRAQGILNKQIVDQCDFAIAIFWTRIGTHTGVALGGAVEEVQRLMGDGKQVMFYFSNVPFRKKDVDLDQVAALELFKKSLQKNAFVQEYDERHEFRQHLVHQLCLNINRWYNLNAQTESIGLNESQQSLQRYQEMRHRHLSEVNLAGSPAIESFSVKLSDTFVSLRLSNTWRSDRRFKDDGIYDDSQDGTLTRNPEEVMSLVFRHYCLLLVVGDPGSGKTTLLKYYSLSCLEGDQYKEFGFNEPVSVFYLPLRELKKDNDNYESLPSALSSWSKRQYLDVPENDFIALLDRSSSLVLLDGLDEISDVSERKAVCQWIDRTVERFGHARFVVTSRSTGYRKGDGVEIVTPHVRADIMDFTQEQQELFLHKWFKAAYLRELPPFDRPEIARREVQEKRAQAKAETIIAYLNQEHNGSLRGLAGVPLLLQIMAMLWKEREYLPGSRLELYDAALNYLLDYRDRRRGIDPLLAAKDARRVLSPVSLWMQDKLGKDEVDRDAMHTEMQHVLDTLSRTISASEFCRNLVDRAGLLVEYGEKEYVFRHKTFREYLAGVQLVKNVHRTNGFLDDLVKHFGDDWWLEPLRFFIAQLEDADLFDLFMQKLFDSPVTEYMTPKQQNLLLTLIREAPQKKIDAIKKALFDLKTSNNRKSYLAECLKAMGRYDASVAVRRFELKYVESKIYRNIYEYNTPYILIEGGIFTYSLSNKSAAIGDFYMAKYPVTNRCYCQFMDYLMTGKFNGVDAISLEAFFGVLHRVGVIKNFLSGANALKSRVDNLVLLFESQFYDDKRFNGDDHPVVGISWYAAKAYCIWLSLMESGGDNPYRYRLPSEIEWEYAAAGKDGRTYPWGYAAPNQTLANYNQNEGTTTPVGSYPEGATPQGINDMAGNVWEWMDNWYDNDKDGRALRGGSWYFHHDLLRSSSRDGSYPDGRYYDFGFRVMRNAYSI